MSTASPLESGEQRFGQLTFDRASQAECQPCYISAVSSVTTQWFLHNQLCYIPISNVLQSWDWRPIEAGEGLSSKLTSVETRLRTSVHLRHTIPRKLQALVYDILPRKLQALVYHILPCKLQTLVYHILPRKLQALVYDILPRKLQALVYDSLLP